MTAEIENSDEVIEGTVFNERQVRLLKNVVIGLGILLLLGFALVIITIVYQASQLGGDKTDETAAISQTISQTGATRIFTGPAIAPGSKIISTSLSGSRVAITLEKNGAYSILVIDVRSGKLLSRTELAPKP